MHDTARKPPAHPGQPLLEAEGSVAFSNLCDLNKGKEGAECMQVYLELEGSVKSRSCGDAASCGKRRLNSCPAAVPLNATTAMLGCAARKPGMFLAWPAPASLGAC
jgi:hypothetical protein